MSKARRDAHAYRSGSISNINPVHAITCHLLFLVLSILGSLMKNDILFS